MKKNIIAFTLIELLIVVAIIAVLAAIATPNMLEAQTRAKVSRCKADLRSIAAGIESYAVDHNSYPLNGVLIKTGGFENPQTTPGGPPAHKFLYEGLTTPIAYMTTVNNDPLVQAVEPIQPGWEPFYNRYFYTNLDWFAHVMLPADPPVIQAKRDIYGIWILAGAGPDGDRLDLALDIHYDPTNGTVSNGDIIRSMR